MDLFPTLSRLAGGAVPNDRPTGTQYEWVIGPTQRAVGEYKASLHRYPNPPGEHHTVLSREL